MKRKYKWLIGCLVFIAILLLSAGMYFFHVAEVRDVAADKPDKLRAETNSLYHYEHDFLSREKQTWTQKTSDNLKLIAWYVPAEKKTGKTAILAHGWHNNKTTMAIYGELFHELGYNVLIPDNRAHGDSQGEMIGYGWLDRRDYIGWLNQILENNGQKSDIVMYGMSMGAATVLSTSGENDLPNQVKAIIADSSYTSVIEEIKHEAGDMYGLPWFPLVNVVSGISKVRAGYSYEEASPLRQVEKNTRPTFFIQGGADTFVPTKMVYPLYNASRGPKQLWITKGSKHVQSFHDYPVAYRSKIKAFLEKYDK
ncbi:alpha/beta hydrolase [Leuconostoc mesenteroides]|uniref:alpha/beta hydrolase n=1 Tax=Leuconostoc mesenteroides TaxID=1245 RepID=UPI0021A7ED58|nr:alpha/beta hydrolase [Leuconostoc mesenteroides]MCT3048686.1 alpha/beta hydrolase [Leuconostoc mesenteroides]